MLHLPRAAAIAHDRIAPERPLVLSEGTRIICPTSCGFSYAAVFNRAERPANSACSSSAPATICTSTFPRGFPRRMDWMRSKDATATSL
jgi:hypothetical protein